MQNSTSNTEATLIHVFTTEIGGISALAVNARELHQFLGVKTKCSDWIRKRIEEYEFVENEDYVLISENSETKTGRGGNRRSIDFILKINIAKELAMVEKNETGKMVRKYFIECERKIHEIPKITKQEPKQPTSTTTQIPPHFVLKEQGELNRAFTTRVWFWTLEKRDRIIHHGIDWHALFSITMDIRDGLKNELYHQCLKHFSSTTSGEDPELIRFIPELIRFINEWEPEFIREMVNVA